MKIHTIIISLITFLVIPFTLKAETGFNVSAAYVYGEYSADAGQLSGADDVDGVQVSFAFDMNESWTIEGLYRYAQAANEPIDISEFGIVALHNWHLNDGTILSLGGGYGRRSLSHSGLGTLDLNSGIFAVKAEKSLTDSLRAEIDYYYVIPTDRDNVEISEAEVSLIYSIDGIYEMFFSYREQVSGSKNLIQNEGVFSIGFGFDV